jgi:putative hydrolase of HD superfamily
MRKIRNPKSEIRKETNFLFEACALKRLKRTGWQILGGGNQESIAEHSYIVAVISFVLVKELNANLEKALVMALFHDFSEGRTGDVYKLADLYITVDEKKADNDAFSHDIRLNNIINEYKEKKSIESQIVHDADNLALILELKALMENGNCNAKEWFEANKDRLELKESKQLFEEIRNSDTQNWWKKEREKIHKAYKK